MSVDFSTLQNLGLTGTSQTGSASSNKNSLGQDTFMKLMMTQLQYQNPLKPQDGAEFVSQLAQFSMVSGINSLQSDFTKFMSSMNQNQTLQAANLVGKSVVIESDKGELGPTGGLNGQFDVPAGASNVNVQIVGANGVQLRTISLGDLPAGSASFTWDGLLDDGMSRANAGLYTIKASALVEGKTEAITPQIQHPVESVTLAGSKGIEIDLGGLGRHGLGDILEVR